MDLPNYLLSKYSGITVSSHHDRIERLATLFGLPDLLLKARSGDILMSAERADLIDGGRLETVLKNMEARLHEEGVDEETILSAGDAVLELAGNAALHGRGSQSEPELVVVSRDQSQLNIYMFGYARESQIKRIHEIIQSIEKIAKPPDHRQKLFARRYENLRRTEKSPSARKQGAGVGMLTLAALSNRPLEIKFGSTKWKDSFALQMSI